VISWMRTNRPDVATFKAFSDQSARVG